MLKYSNILWKFPANKMKTRSNSGKIPIIERSRTNFIEETKYILFFAHKKIKMLVFRKNGFSTRSNKFKFKQRLLPPSINSHKDRCSR